MDWFDDWFKWWDEGLILDLRWFNLCTIFNNCLFLIKFKLEYFFDGYDLVGELLKYWVEFFCNILCL